MAAATGWMFNAHHAQKNDTVAQLVVRNKDYRRPISAAGMEPLGTKEVYLSAEERYSVWLVKAAERPELLKYDSTEEEESFDKDADGNVLPLTDGCDIPGWRKERMTGRNGCLSQEVLAVLNIGPGCPLLRRESQIPILGRRSVCSETATPWDLMRHRLFEKVPATRNQAERIHYKDCSSLHPVFELQNRPAVIEGCTVDWTAMKSCRFERLVERFGHLEWRFSDTHGETMSLRTYSKYISSLEGLSDDAPLAVYDSQFGYDERKAIIDEYKVPVCFDTDLFAHIEAQEDEVDDQQRPPYRWILIGPERSGTGLHIDPVGTHAWVTLVQGCKRWVLFPPDTPPAAIYMQNPQIPSVVWFRDHYEEALLKYPTAVEVLQFPGETVYVPAGWPHLVLNLELSVAITHNYATKFPSIERLWTAVADAEPELASRFHQSLELQRPELAERIAAVTKPKENDNQSMGVPGHCENAVNV